MARKPMVTRTIQTTKAKVLCLNVETAQSFVQEVVLPRTYKDDKAVLKMVEEIVNNDTVKAAHVISTEVNETLYGMTEQKFIELAKPLTSRNGDTEDEENNEKE